MIVLDLGSVLLKNLRPYLLVAMSLERRFWPLPGALTAALSCLPRSLRSGVAAASSAALATPLPPSPRGVEHAGASTDSAAGLAAAGRGEMSIAAAPPPPWLWSSTIVLSLGAPWPLPPPSLPSCRRRMAVEGEGASEATCKAACRTEHETRNVPSRFQVSRLSQSQRA